MKKTTNVLRKSLALIVGLPLLVLGVILIPLPGPGFLTVFAALWVLSLGFDSLKPARDKAQAEIRKIWQKSMDQRKKVLEKYEEKA